MSRFDHVMNRRLENVVSRRRPKSGAPGGVITVLKQHVRGDVWWRMKFADLIDKRTEAAKAKNATGRKAHDELVAAVNPIDVIIEAAP